MDSTSSGCRKFRPEWIKEFPWLQENEGRAYCVACEKTLISHLTHLRKHATNNTHKQNLNNKNSQLKLDTFLTNEKRGIQQQVYLAELTMVMFCIQHKLPFLLMDFLPKLLAECCPDSAIAKALKCARTKSTEVAEALGTKALTQIASSLRSSKFSLIVDETTDISSKKSLVLVVRYVDSQSRIVRDRFLSLLELTKCDSATIFETIKTPDLVNSMNAETKAYFLFLSYILNIINNLNKEFQSEKVRLPYLYSHIETNFKLIMSHFLKNDFVKNISCLSQVNFNDENNYLPIENIFVGYKAENFFKCADLTMSQKLKIKSDILFFYRELLKQINSRFDFASDDLQLLSIITPHQVVCSSEINILPLVNKFSNLVNCDPEKIMTQWSILRLSHTNLSSEMDINSFWGKVYDIKNGMNENCFKELCEFVFILLTLPHSSAAAERMFSELALIKTKKRNKLDFRTINNVMLAAELDNSKSKAIWSASSYF